MCFGEDDDIFTVELNDGDDGKGEPIPARGAHSARARAAAPDQRGETRKAADIVIDPVKRILQPDKPATVRISERQRRLNEFTVAREAVSRMNRGPVQYDFAEQAVLYADRTHEETAHVPFFSYWPTYEAMSEAQAAWYFYWRGETRRGNWLSTDISYIFLQVYELINMIGAGGPEDCFARLCGIWSAYRGRYPSLDSYMVLWLQDYIAIHAGEIPPGELLRRMPDASLIGLFPDGVLEDYMASGEAALPVEMISRFTDYKFYLSKYCGSETGGRLLAFIPLAVAHENRRMIEAGGAGIFTVYKPEAVQTRKHIPYQNAVYRGAVKAVETVKVPYSEFGPLRAFITGVIKHTENLLREHDGFRGRLKGYALPEETARALKSFVADALRREEAEKRSNITVDRDRILQLINDSNAVRDSLLSGIEAIMDAGAGEEGGATVPVGSDIAAVPQTERLAQEATGSEGLLGALSGEQAEIVRFITGNGRGAAEADISARFPGVFIGMEIDAINGASIDALGDILLVNEDGKWVVCDDFADDVEKSFGLKGESHE